MEAIDKSLPKEGPTTVGESNSVKSTPPAIITVDTAKKGDEKQDTAPKPEGSDDPSFRQARTPKHANKTMGGKGDGAEDAEVKSADKQNPVNLAGSMKGSAYPTQEKKPFPQQHSDPNHRPPPQSVGGFHKQPYQGHAPSSQPGYFPHTGGDSYPSQGQRQPFESGPRRPGPPMVGGANGAFSPHDSQFRENTNHPRFYNNRGQLPTVSPGGRDGGDYRTGAPYYGRGEPQSSGYPSYRGDERGPPRQPQGFPSRDHRPGAGPQYSGGGFSQQGAYGRHPSQYGGPPHPNHPHAFHREQPHPAGSGYQDQHRPGFGGQAPSGPQFQGRPPPYPHAPHPHADYHHRQTPTQDKATEGRPDQAGVGGVTRAVSSSFDKSVRSRNSNEESNSDAPQMNRGIGQKVEQPHGQGFQYGAEHRPPSQADGGSEAPSDDSSWRQLNQVASVDEDAIRARIKEKEESKSSRNTATPSQQDGMGNQPGSNSSSLTNSPTDHKPLDSDHNTAGSKHQPPVPTPSKLASLDSLSSVASAQEPMETDDSKLGKARSGGPPSPGSSNASLDLMKCSSGSSGLLQGFPSAHQRGGSDGSYNAYRGENKRLREERDPTSNPPVSGDDPRRAPPDIPVAEKQGEQDHPSKRSRHNETDTSGDKKDGNQDPKKDNAKLKASPLSIACSPPHSPRAEGGGHQSERPKSNTDSSHHTFSSASHIKNPSDSNYSLNSSPGPSGNSYLDKMPTYTYSYDSNHSREDSRKGSYPFLSNRPSSSSSSTITPVGPPNTDGVHREGVGPSLASWDLHNQDSFGAGSLGGSGPPLINSFSFNQDIGYSGSHEQERGMEGPEHPHQGPPRQSHSAPPHGRHDGRPPTVAESRNQSFEGGHYHGSFDRSHGMDTSYGPEGQRQSTQQAHGENQKASHYSGPFPPHAPSWGTTTSTGSTGPSSQIPSIRGAAPGQFSQYGSQQRSSVHHSPHSRHPTYHGAMMRNYSEDSAMRTSPPPGPHSQSLGAPGSVRPGAMNARSSFQAPPEFAAPQNPRLSRRPPPAVFIMSTPPGGNPRSDPSLIPKRGTGTGVYSWTKDDDVRLNEIMKKYKNPRDWEPIAKEHGRGKTAKECHERWIRYLKPGVRKGQWQDHEDAIVVEAVTTSTEQPFTRWSDLAQRLPGRVGKQIRDRWVNHLNPNINHLPFSREDDLLLWEGHKKLGKRWVEISTKFFNCSRSENHIKNRWYSASFKKFIANEYGQDAYTGGKPPKKDDKGKAKKGKDTVAV